MRVLSEIEKQIIKTIKGHYSTYTIDTSDWYTSLSPLFSRIYDFKFNESKGKIVMFNNLFLILIKLQSPGIDSNIQLLSIIHISFAPSVQNSQDDPVDRCIGKVCELIFSNSVSGRYSLN